MKMKTMPLILLAVGLAASLALALLPVATPRAHGAAADPAAGPVVLELFTSQGCSSCPPADRLLSQLASSGKWQGRVIPLSFHVDYWNYIGWTDPFSSGAWSRRQREYARVMDSNRVYTPQLVVDGRGDCVGSQRSCVEREIERALARSRSWRVEVRVSGGRSGVLRAEVAARATGKAAGEPRLLVALTESGLSTPVGRGENAHRTLRNDCVVRRLVPAPRLEGAVVELELEEGWRPGKLGVAALVQDRRSLHILGAAQADPEQVVAAATAASTSPAR